MDIEIKNKEQALSVCQTIQNEKLKQLSNCISSLESNISSVKEKWSSTGIDKETYVIELEKQTENLRIIYQLLGGFSKTITNYTENVQRTAANTLGAVSTGASMAAVSGALAGISALKGANSNSSGNGGGGILSSLTNGVNTVTNSVNRVVNKVKDAALKATNSNGASSVGKNTSSNGNVGGANNKVDSGSIVGSTSIGGGSSYSGGGSSYSGEGSSYGSGGSSYSGTTGSGYSSGYSSGLSSSDISSVHGNVSGSVSSGLGSADGVVSTSNGMIGSVEDNSSATDNIVNGFNESVGSVTASTSNLFTNNKLGAIVPKLTAPVGLKSSTAKKSVPAVPVISGVAAAGVAGVGGFALLNKKKDVETTENLVIENWEENPSEEKTNDVATIEQKLGELTFDDILG